MKPHIAIAYLIQLERCKIERRQSLKFSVWWPAHSSEPMAHFLFVDEMNSAPAETLCRRTSRGRGQGQLCQDMSQLSKMLGPGIT